MSSKFLDKTGLDTLWAKIKSTFQTLGNLVTAWGSTPSDTKYPSEKLVKVSLDGKVSVSDVKNASWGVNILRQSFQAKNGTTVDNTNKTITATYDTSKSTDIYCYASTNVPIVLGETYTISFDVIESNLTEGQYWEWGFFGQGHAVFRITGTGHYSKTLVSDINRSVGYGALIDDGGKSLSNGSYIVMKNIKYEIGPFETKYTDLDPLLVTGSNALSTTLGPMIRALVSLSNPAEGEFIPAASGSSQGRYTLRKIFDFFKSLMVSDSGVNISGNAATATTAAGYTSGGAIDTALQGKVDKETGKGLSTNDFTDAYKSDVDSNTSARHTHPNKSVLDGISSTDVDNWDGKQDDLGISSSGDAGKFLNEQGSWQVPGYSRSDGHSVWYRNSSWTTSNLLNQYVGKSTTWDNTYNYDLTTLKAGDTIKIYVTVTNMANAHFVMDLKVTAVDSVAPTATVMAIYQADQNEVLDGTNADANDFIIPGNYILQNVTLVTKNWPGSSSGSLDITNLCVTRLVRNNASSPFSTSIDIQQSVRWSSRQLYRTKVNGTWGSWRTVPMCSNNYYEAVGSTTLPIYVDARGRVVECDDPWNYIKTKIHNGSLGSANRPVYWTGSNLALSKPSPNVDLMGTAGKDTAAKARADTTELVNTTINCNNSDYRYLNVMRFIENVPYTFLIPSVNANKSGLVTSTKLDVYPIGASDFNLGTNATLYLDKAGGSSAQHEIVFAYRIGTTLYIFHQY